MHKLVWPEGEDNSTFATGFLSILIPFRFIHFVYCVAKRVPLAGIQNMRAGSITVK